MGEATPGGAQGRDEPDGARLGRADGERVRAREQPGGLRGPARPADPDKRVFILTRSAFAGHPALRVRHVVGGRVRGLGEPPDPDPGRPQLRALRRPLVDHGRGRLHRATQVVHPQPPARARRGVARARHPLVPVRDVLPRCCACTGSSRTARCGSSERTRATGRTVPSSRSTSFGIGCFPIPTPLAADVTRRQRDDHAAARDGLPRGHGNARHRRSVPLRAVSAREPGHGSGGDQPLRVSPARGGLVRLLDGRACTWAARRIDAPAPYESMPPLRPGRLDPADGAGAAVHRREAGRSPHALGLHRHRRRFRAVRGRRRQLRLRKGGRSPRSRFAGTRRAAPCRSASARGRFRECSRRGRSGWCSSRRPRRWAILPRPAARVRSGTRAVRSR